MMIIERNEKVWGIKGLLVIVSICSLFLRLDFYLLKFTFWNVKM